MDHEICFSKRKIISTVTFTLKLLYMPIKKCLIIYWKFYPESLGGCVGDGRLAHIVHHLDPSLGD